MSEWAKIAFGQPQYQYLLKSAIRSVTELVRYDAKEMCRGEYGRNGNESMTAEKFQCCVR